MLDVNGIVFRKHDVDSNCQVLAISLFAPNMIVGSQRLVQVIPVLDEWLCV